MSLTTQIEHYAGSASGYSSVVSQALSDGVVDVVTKVIALRPDQAQHFSQMTVTTNGSGVTLDYSLPVLFVSRKASDGNGYPCLRGVFDIKDKYVDQTSIVYATKYDPIFYLDKSGNDVKVIIKPDPSGTEPGYVTRVVIGTPNDGLGTISHFPQNYVHLVVKYSAMRVIHAKIETLRQTLPTDLDASTIFGVIADIDLTTDLTNTTGLTYDLSADLATLNTYIETDEDIELAASKLGEIKLKFDMIKSELDDKISKASPKERELLSNINKDMQAYSAKIQKHMQEYMMLVERMKTISAEYASAFDAIGGMTK